MGNSDDKVETAALVISLVALIGTFLQVLQQYFASATGYSNCQKSLSGGWLHTLRRKFRPNELRFEVLYKAPVIFVCGPDNRRGPVPGEPLRFLTGSDESKWKAWIWTQTEQDEPEAKEEQGRILKTWKTWLKEKLRQVLRSKAVAWLWIRQGKEQANNQPQHHNNRVLTADNEEATWLKLLRQINGMEKDSTSWVNEYHKQTVNNHHGKKERDIADNIDEYAKDAGADSPTILPGPKQHTLVVALQPKHHSWDNMPAGVKKPYAITTMCHIVEIAAMLGIYWKEFDRSRDKYRAEGNGYMLTGSTVPDLGLCFTFQISGKARFRENRTIPVDGIKSLCFGYIPTIFQEDEDLRRLDAKDPDELQLGSMAEIAETMVQLGCNTSTANYFKTTDTVHQHLFAGKSTFYQSLWILSSPIFHSALRDHRDFFDLTKLIREFEAKVNDTKYAQASKQTRALKRLAGKVVRQLDRNDKDVNQRKDEIKESKKAGRERKTKPKTKQDPEEKAQVEAEVREPQVQRETTFSDMLSLQRLVSWMTMKEGVQGEGKKAEEGQQPKDQLPVISGYYLPLLNQLHDAIEECDDYLLSCDRGLVNMVIREHLQEIVKMINEPMTEQPGDINGKSTAAAMTEEKKDAKKPTALTFFEKLSEANPEDRQREFMGTYFEDVLKKVGSRAVLSYKRLNKGYVTGQKTATPPLTPDVTFHSSEPHRTLPFSPATQALDAQALEPTQEAVAQAIWCTLIFRMLCWLQLHDFDKKDKQSAKSELRGSRLPVFIS
ncbi:hypothetical protein B0T09DRAFT_264064 [Sordaria sp. MPI-SDFR-AT-0083]|nr:hypothetical protein B0T09DRAFT_264064 [Sordaria sp. MPI-SDFR-AT-0083]